MGKHSISNGLRIKLKKSAHDVRCEIIGKGLLVLFMFRINTSCCHSRWVNRKDPDGKNIFSGGFLGLDNIGVYFANISCIF